MVKNGPVGTYTRSLDENTLGGPKRLSKNFHGTPNSIPARRTRTDKSLVLYSRSRVRKAVSSRSPAAIHSRMKSELTTSGCFFSLGEGSNWMRSGSGIPEGSSVCLSVARLVFLSECTTTGHLGWPPRGINSWGSTGAAFRRNRYAGILVRLRNRIPLSIAPERFFAFGLATLMSCGGLGHICAAVNRAAHSGGMVVRLGRT